MEYLRQYMEKRTWYEDFKAQGLYLTGRHKEAELRRRALRDYWDWSLAKARHTRQPLDPVSLDF